MRPASKLHHVSRVVTVTVFVSLVLGCLHADAQSDTTLNRRKVNTFLLAAGAGYTAGLLTLNHVWYKNTERQSFQFFNDNAEWKQLDKAGHFFASFYLSELPAGMLKRYGMREHKADLVGALTGFLSTLPIEILDGFSDGYGASVGDVLADAAGPAFYFGQQLAWHEIRIRPKFSFHRTGYAPLRPALLGDDLLSELVKDYNGQTYWLSVDLDRFTAFPRWLNVALGYGAQDMVYARDQQNTQSGYDPYRQYYLAVDVDLSGIRTRSRVVRTLLSLVSAVRLPAPALALSRKGAKFHPLYF